MPCKDDQIFEAIRRVQEVTSIAQNLASNVAIPRLPEASDFEIALSTPEPMFDEYSEGPESWTILGELVGFTNVDDERKQVFRVVVNFQIMLAEEFDDIVENGFSRPRHEKTAWVGITDPGGKGKSRIHSQYLKVSLPDDLKNGKYEIRPANTGFKRGFVSDDFMPLYPGGGELVNENLLAAMQDAKESGQTR